MDIWIDSKKWDDGWESLEELPGGGQGVAKRVRNKLSGENAFLKLLSRQSDSERRARFFREATAYATCSHISIPRLVQSNAHKHTNPEYKLFIVTEFIPGPTLTTIIEKDGPLAFEHAVTVSLHLLDVVNYCHDQDWVHRDIKPDNVILRDGDPSKPVLLDFGLAYKDGITLDFQTEHGQEIGNRFIHLPELAAGSPLKQDVRSDLAFLGSIFFYLLTGVAPSTVVDGEGRMPHQRLSVVNSLRHAAGRATTSLLGFFDRIFVQKLSDRYATAKDMRRALETVMHEREGNRMKESGDDLQVILAALNTQANKQMAMQKTQYDAAMDVIRSVHSELVRQVAPTYVSYQSGYVNFAEGLRNVLGFAHFTTHDQRFAPMFYIRIVGEELVIQVDDIVIYRTDAGSPFLNVELKEKVRSIYLRGLRDLIEKPFLSSAGHEFFKSRPFTSLSEAKAVAASKTLPLFIVLYDENHPTCSKLNHSLGYFLEYDTTKNLVEEHFVSVVASSSQPDARALIPADDPLEKARWIVLSSDGEVVRSEGVYANPDEGLERVRSAIEQCNRRP